MRPKQPGLIRPIDLTRRVRNRIHLVGIELEGGWSKLPKGTALVHDGSVRFQGPEIIAVTDPATGRRTQQVVPGSGPPHVGELPSPPLEVSVKGSSTIPWMEWVKQFYPSHVNDSCGMHVHMSFRSALTYQRLMTPDYQVTMMDHLIKWARKVKFGENHHIWERLNGTNRYCQHQFMAEEQAQRREKSHDHHAPGHRYTAINYAYGQHSTVECRVLPMMDTSAQAIDAISQVLLVTNAFLLVDAKREQPIIANHLIDDDYHLEEFHECV